ncbi:ATP-dependent zinc protease family protein [Gilvimarinus algae]|uniref:ATP-dependent zinc protease n=1 Tax=Gilvimarinus algae TaxID=3058037 RepID=A0ABT8THH5_9GAMM|nr:ATP-dependent zinc protease [Gilvimarinus sp. SDUM040014]MDO3383554.1 ATP-dependent zinc protease [Gilvimarinus sp. SDUM040014]
MTSNNKTCVGWREWVMFPDFGQFYVKAKVDTGAKTSALHAFFVEPFSRSGNDWVRFGLHPKQHSNEPEYICESPVLDRRTVTDSGGHKEERYVIETAISIAGNTLLTEMTLTNRETMLFRMLLGRNTLSGHFLVDPELSFLCGGDKTSAPDTERR